MKAALILIAAAMTLALWKAGFGAPTFDGVTLAVFILCGLAVLAGGVFRGEAKRDDR